jgi:hypothetical protein
MDPNTDPLKSIVSLGIAVLAMVVIVCAVWGAMLVMVKFTQYVL